MFHWVLTACQNNSVGEKNRFFSQIVLGQLDIYRQKNKVGLLHQIIYKTQNRSKVKYKTKIIKLLEENNRVNFCDFGLGKTKNQNVSD